ncbi:MAG: class I SAM-dependent methyltransferase [Candidatus Korobacteraceae bacterium]|jgi:cephalosporin hydroxylase
MTLAGRIMRQTLPKKAADRLAFAVNTYRRYRDLRRALNALCQQYAALNSLDEQIDLLCGHKIFGAIQQHNEVSGLLKVLKQNPPRYVCEIGTASGGTLFLLAQVCAPGALLLSVDLGLSVERCFVHARFATRKQRIISIRGDSRAPTTLERVRSLLHGHPLDLLFIDGDHSYNAVKADFIHYSPMVRPGGLIVFHDIVRDFGTRYGKPIGSYTGGVPVLWEEIKTRHRTSELIEDPQQDGYGIGIVHN